MEAISSRLDTVQRMANDTTGEIAVFHPDAVGEVRRVFAAEALEELAGGAWTFAANDTVPEDWKQRTSTYLKSWSCRLNPLVLLNMADLLIRAGMQDRGQRSL
jgi:hypothetical protein